MKVLVTGGAGYIGSTICSALEENGHVPIVLDSLINGQADFVAKKIFYQGDIANSELVAQIFYSHPEIEACIHCAALILVPESVEKPYDYYKENVAKSIEFFKTLSELNCKKIVFSSSASLYDTVPEFMVTEDSPLKPSSPYAKTKYMMEMVLADFCFSYGIQGIALRYFNPIGADPQMRSGQYTKNPSHILGKLLEVYQEKSSYFQITGNDWPSRDGSGIRDYIHVWDLALAHVKSIENFSSAFAKANNKEQNKASYLTINLGTGKGVTVKEFVKAFENVVKKELPKKMAPPRLGDVAGAYANASRAHELIGWQAQKSIEEAIGDALQWMTIFNQESPRVP